MGLLDDAFELLELGVGDDLGLIEELIADRVGWKAVADETVGAGGCVAETEAGKVDGEKGPFRWARRAKK